MTIHRYPSGMNCWTWIVPDQWECDEAYLERLNGERIFSHAENPLHVAAYSQPFDGVVSREELFEHLHTHENFDDSIPFIMRYYNRRWDLACSRRVKESLADEQYRVVIRSRFTPGELRVGEAVFPGESEDCIVLCSHLDHSAQANDDLAGVLVGLEVMKRLQALGKRHYTYRYLILPETIGSIAYLSQNEHLIPGMRGGLFFEMLGLDNPHALQLSLPGDTFVDRCFQLALAENSPGGWTGKFRTVVGNDERQFNSPGVDVPMLSLSRVLKPSQPLWPYPEYHSSRDNAGLINWDHMEESVQLALKMLDYLEKDEIVVSHYKGEVFCSRYGLHVDWFSDREGNDRMFDIMYQFNGRNTVSQIAVATGATFGQVRDLADRMALHGLVSFKR